MFPDHWGGGKDGAVAAAEQFRKKAPRLLQSSRVLP